MGPERPIMQQAGRLLVDAIKEAISKNKILTQINAD
jgi:hypothetical protein